MKPTHVRVEIRRLEELGKFAERARQEDMNFATEQSLRFIRRKLADILATSPRYSEDEVESNA